MTVNNEIVYESPEMELIEISSEGILCASDEDTQESYLGEDEYEIFF